MTERFYGMNAFMKSIDTRMLGRKTYEASLRLGAKFDKDRTIVFSRQAPPADAPPGVEFLKGPIGLHCSCTPLRASKMVWFSCTTVYRLR